MTPSEREEIREIALKEHPACIEDIDSCSIYRAILTQVEKARAEERERCAKIAESHEPSDEATSVLRCNPGAEKAYIDSSTMNGYDWACDDIATSIRNKLEKE